VDAAHGETTQASTSHHQGYLLNSTFLSEDQGRLAVSMDHSQRHRRGSQAKQATIALHVVDTDFGGDTVLIVGPAEQPVRLTVSRPIMVLVSPYFASLLGPNFCESRATELRLEDDDPASMIILCKLLHHKFDLDRPLPSAHLLGLAVVADKYDCLTAIHLRGCRTISTIH
jgi:hypothetical protein